VSESRRIGRLSAWVFVRCMVCFFLVAGAAGFIALSNYFPLNLLALAAGALPLLLFFAESTLWANDEGIRFRRWFKEYKVSWQMIRKVDYYPFRSPELRLRLKASVGWSRVIHVSAITRGNPSLKQAWQLATQKEVPEEIVFLREKVSSLTRQ
jgi:hypothetical protein